MPKTADDFSDPPSDSNPINLTYPSGNVTILSQIEAGLSQYQNKTKMVAWSVFGGSATHFASPPPRPSIFSNYSFLFHHHIN
jgi:hypothetical protein